ncbi:long-chain fatty acid--CoA ligase [Rhodococcus sp. X156]|uniref:long-chain-fatty-acid--CoA ligase n=1 Tax=Rhodococcus sp. X156 TaxID=2499145 RepID=UPI000FD81DBF|nr:long-chain fatty acid--CoA ligase [Rhodococcus sp. X156]
MTNIAENLARSVQRDPSHPAVKLDDLVLDYAALDGATAHLAGLLKAKGLKPGDAVGVSLPNVPHFPIVYYGVLRAGGVVVPLNPLLKQREVAYHLADSGAKWLFAWQDFAEAGEKGAADANAECIVVTVEGFTALVGAAEPAPEVVERADEDTAVILYTSGTTGKPKGAELTHHNLNSNSELSASTLLNLGPDDVMLGALPLFHAFGQTCALNTVIRAGATLTLIPRFDATKALEVLQRDKVTAFAGVPTMYAAMLHHPEGDSYDLSNLRVCVSGGSAMPVEVMRGFEEKFGCTVLEGYGLSETSPVATFNLPDRERKAGSIGVAVKGVEVTLLDEDGNEVGKDEVGEICIRGENIMKGYWNNPEATAAAIVDGWFHSGDLARVDDEGYYYIVDRKKDLIIRGGFNVYPREVEEVLYEHPAVAEAAVIGMPHDDLGEEICAVVALKAGAEATPEELIAHVKPLVAAYKYPRKVLIVDELPKGATGKILKREISAG